MVVDTAYGKSIKEIGFITSEYDDTGACAGLADKLDDAGNPILDENGEAIQVEVDCSKIASSMQSTLIIDTRNLNVKVYPLLITITGQDADVVLKARTWAFSFDRKTWQYKVPANYPLADMDF